ncbi:MAG: hypothetical protein NTY68_01250 [Candidatus Micrarchaeota archaeon]|nr:hypothetical protein [Candidatus Micrarchaeota archaeon]
MRTIILAVFVGLVLLFGCVGQTNTKPTCYNISKQTQVCQPVEFNSTSCEIGSTNVSVFSSKGDPGLVSTAEFCYRYADDNSRCIDEYVICSFILVSNDKKSANITYDVILTDLTSSSIITQEKNTYVNLGEPEAVSSIFGLVDRNETCSIGKLSFQPICKTITNQKTQCTEKTTYDEKCE